MKIKILFLSSFIFTLGLNAQQLPKQKIESFKRGEKLSFRLHYGFISAGTATLEVKEEFQRIGNRNTFHVIGIGESQGAFDWFFRVRDRYETFIDEEALLPWVFIRRVDEGGYHILEDYVFNQFKNKVDCGKGMVFNVLGDAQDMISAFYYARNLDYSNAKKGDVFAINTFVDKKDFTVKIKYVGEETIKTDLGKFRCIKFNPVIQTGRIFKSEEDCIVWITNDKNHIPLRVEGKIMVGSIKMDLTDYSGLANPISKVE